MSNQLMAALPGAVLGFLGVIASAGATLYARNLKHETRLGLIEPRLKAYRSLWKHLELAAPSMCLEDPTKKIMDETNRTKKQLTAEEIGTIRTNLRCWYYSEDEGGNGIFLSAGAAEVYRDAVKALLDAEPDDEGATRQVVYRLSKLRSRTKNEIAVYGRWEE